MTAEISGPVLVIEHETGAGLSLLEASLGVRTRVIRPYLGDAVPDLTDQQVRPSGLIVLGGEPGAWDDDVAPWLPATRALLGRAVREQIPTFAICLGAQLLAQSASPVTLPIIAVVVAAALFCGGLTYAVIGSDGSARTSVIFLAAVTAIIGLLALVLIERRSKAPMLTGELLRHRTVTFGSLAGLLYNFGLYGLIFLISLYLQGTRHVGSIAVGVSLLPLAGAALAVALGASALMHRLGPRICTSVGMGCACLGTLAILSYTDHPSLAWVVFPGAIVGFGGGLFTPSISNAVLSGAPDGQQGRASALLNASRQFGSALGAAVVGSVLSTHPSSVEFQHALFTVAGAYLAGSLLCAAMLPRRTTAS